MNLFWLIFWICVVVDCVVPGVNIALGWYFFFGLLGLVLS